MSGRHYSMEQRHGKSTVVQMQCLCDVDISQSIENIMDGKDYQRGSIEKDASRQRNSAAIWDKKVAISKTYNKI